MAQPHGEATTLSADAAASEHTGVVEWEGLAVLRRIFCASSLAAADERDPSGFTRGAADQPNLRQRAFLTGFSVPGSSTLRPKDWGKPA